LRQYNPLEELEKDPSLKPYSLPPLKPKTDELTGMWFEGFWTGIILCAAIALLISIRNG